jgi:hypothetical protein
MDFGEPAACQVGVDGRAKRFLGRALAEGPRSRTGVKMRLSREGGLAQAGSALTIFKLAQKVVIRRRRVAPRQKPRRLEKKITQENNSSQAEHTHQHPPPCDSLAHAMTFRRWSARRNVSAIEFIVGLDAL